MSNGRFFPTTGTEVGTWENFVQVSLRIEPFCKINNETNSIFVFCFS